MRISGSRSAIASISGHLSGFALNMYLSGNGALTGTLCGVWKWHGFCTSSRDPIRVAKSFE